MRHQRTRPGVSLLEVVIAIAILGVMGTVVGLAWQPRGRALDDDYRSPMALVSAARREALNSGVSVTIRVETDARMDFVTALPDGRLLGAESLGFHPLTGRRVDSTSQRMEAAAVSGTGAPGRPGRVLQ